MLPLIQLPVSRPTVHDGEIRGEIVRTDSFGNLITNIDAGLLPEAARETLVIELSTQRIQGICRCYGERPADELLALVGSSGRLEIAICEEHAGQRLAARTGDAVLVKGLPAPARKDVLGSVRI
jgi:hypothetical protein